MHLISVIFLEKFSGDGKMCAGYRGCTWIFIASLNLTRAKYAMQNGVWSCENVVFCNVIVLVLIGAESSINLLCFNTVIYTKCKLR